MTADINLRSIGGSERFLYIFYGIEMRGDDCLGRKAEILLPPDDGIIGSLESYAYEFAGILNCDSAELLGLFSSYSGDITRKLKILISCGL